MNQREIKFRYVWQHEDTGNISMPIFSLYRIASEGLAGVDRHILISTDEFSGIRDKNDKEIYENDILLVLYSDWPSKPEDFKGSLDEYLESIAKVVVAKHADKYDVGPHGFVKVIGNIYENEVEQLINE